MRLTFQEYRNSASIYFYIREFDGFTVNTITNLLGQLLYDTYGNWIGVEVTNINVVEEKIQLPRLKSAYIAKEAESFIQSEGRIVIVFDKNLIVSRCEPVYCNIDYNEVNGLQGIEILVEHFTGKMNFANQYI